MTITNDLEFPISNSLFGVSSLQHDGFFTLASIYVGMTLVTRVRPYVGINYYTMWVRPHTVPGHVS